MVMTSTQQAARAAAQLHEAAQDVARVAARRSAQAEGREFPMQQGRELTEDVAAESAERAESRAPGAARMADQTGTAGKALARPHESTPQVSVAAGRKGFKAELEDLRERMRRLGLGYDEIAGEVARRYRLRPRESYRLAWGWSLNHAAARFNALAAHEGTDPQARASMTGPHLCEHERWPDGGRKPSVYVLIMLAQMYETDVLCLLDLADHENLAPQDRLTLIRPPQPRAETPFGRKLVALMDERDLSLREMARRVPCSAGSLSNIVHGREGTSAQMAHRLDQVLDAGGALAALVEVPARGHKRVIERGDAPDQSLASPQRLTLSLPYVPGRLVIEVSDQVVSAGRGTPETDCLDSVTGRLALVQDWPSSAQQDGR
jgi:transcriptional regulator with XRE-family HTH domain